MIGLRRRDAGRTLGSATTDTQPAGQWDTTNTAVGSTAAGSKITGLVVGPLIGTGRAVDIELTLPSARHTSTAGAYITAYLVVTIDGVTAAGPIIVLGGSPSTAIGRSLSGRVPNYLLEAGKSYTFEVGVYGQAGTTRIACDAVNLGKLVVTGR